MVRAMRLSIEAWTRRLEQAAATLGARRLGLSDGHLAADPARRAGGRHPRLCQGHGRIRRHHHLRVQHSRPDADAALGDLCLPAGARRRDGGAAAGRGVGRSSPWARSCCRNGSRAGWRRGSGVPDAGGAVRASAWGFHPRRRLCGAGRPDRSVRPLRLGQDQRHQRGGGPVAARAGARRRGRHRAGRYPARHLAAAAQAPPGLCLSGGAAVSASQRAAEPALRPLVRRAPPAPGPGGRDAGIGALLERRPGALSGGERQRVAIGRALAGRSRPDPRGRAAGGAGRGPQGRKSCPISRACATRRAVRSSMSAIRRPRWRGWPPRLSSCRTGAWCVRARPRRC
jgi:hypothetical protein